MISSALSECRLQDLWPEVLQTRNLRGPGAFGTSRALWIPAHAIAAILDRIG